MLKRERGITLIALIITIIVMLILVGVTVNVALTGGLFTKASEASKQMQIEAEKEELLSSVVAAIGYDGKVVLEDIELPTGWTGSNGTYTSPKGNTYTVDENGKITETGTNIGGGNTTDPTQSEDEELLRKYVLGDGEIPKYLNEILNMSTLIFEPDENTITDANETIKFGGIAEVDESYRYFIMRYKRNVYKIKCDTSYKNLDLIPIYTAEGNLGKYVEYAGKTWIVLRDNSSGVELITANATDTEITLGGSDYETARASYNNVVAILVEECKNATGLEIEGDVIGIRCVGGPAIDTTKNTDTIDFSNPMAEFVPQEGFPYASFAGTTEENGLKIGNDEYLDDLNQMGKLGILGTDTPSNYWLASRSVTESPTRVDFNVRSVITLGGILNNYLCYVYNGGSSGDNSPANALRPVVTLKSGVLSGATEKGTIDDPIILN